MKFLRAIVSSAGAGLARALEAVCYAAAAIWLVASLASAGAVLLRGGFSPLLSNAALVGCVILGALGVTLFTTLGELYGQRVRDLRAGRIWAALQRGETPPPYTLYLRPFASTGAFEEMGASFAIGGGGATAALMGAKLELEAQVERAVRPLGPMVALGKPLEHIGAGRILVDEHSWKDAIHALMAHARLVIMLPSSRLGTLEEIEMILGSGIIRRTVLIDPPNVARAKRFDHKSEWDQVQQAFAARGYTVPEETQLGRLLFFGAQREPLFKERLDIDAEDRIERLFQRVIRVLAAEPAPASERGPA